MKYDMKHKHHKVIKAWANGAVIEVKEDEEWREADYPNFYGHIEYRVKPTEPVYKWHWVYYSLNQGIWRMTSNLLTKIEADATFIKANHYGKYAAIEVTKQEQK
jgi:hypothetical protein